MRAISAFSFEAGTSSFWWRERIALRMRVRKSATGSVKLMLSPSSSVRSGLYIDQGQRTSEDGVACRLSPVRQVAVGSWPSLPGRLHDTWNLAAQGKPAEAQTAYAELAQECARAAAQLAAVVLARGKLRLPGVFNTFCSGRHRFLFPRLFSLPPRHLGSSRAEWHTELPQQRACLVVVLRRGDDGDVHALQLLHPGVINLREDELVANAQRVVAAPIEALGRDAAEIAHARQGNRDQPIQKLVHLLAAQC